MAEEKKTPATIEVHGVECTLVRSCEWADFYVGNRPIKGKIRVKFSKKLGEAFFKKYSPHDFTPKDLCSVVTSYLPAPYNDLPDEWKVLMEKCYKQMY